MKALSLTRALAGLAAIFAAGNGIFALFTWWSGKWRIATFGADYLPMALITAMLFALLGLAVAVWVFWPESRAARSAGPLGAAIAIAVSALASGQTWISYSLPWDYWPSNAPATIGAIPVGQMAPLTAFAFLLSAGAFLAYSTRFRTLRTVTTAASVAAAGGLIIGAAVVVSYASGTPLQYGTQTVPMAGLTGLAFMALNFGLLLAGPVGKLLSAGFPVDTAPSIPEEIRSFSRRLLIVGTVAGSLITLAGFFHLRTEQTATREAAGKELDAIANLKAEQITAWRNERLGEARFLLKARGVVEDIAAYAARPEDAAAHARVVGWLEPIKGDTRYESIQVFNIQAGLLLAIPGTGSPQAIFSNESFGEVLASHEPVFTDLLRDPGGTQIHLDLLVPIRPAPDASAAVAVIVLRLNPKQILFPLIQSWPVPSTTAENLLVRREGDEVVYLNELRHQADTALALRRSIHDPRLPAALGASGVVGKFEGRDYRGVAVLATTRRIPGSSWILVSKIDQAEIYAPLRRAALLNTALVASLLLTIALVGVYLWRQRYTTHLRRALTAEQERNVLSKRLALITRHANDIIILFDGDRRIVEANERAQAAYGRTPEEMLRLKVEDLRAPAAKAQLEADFTRALQANGTTFETIHRRRSGAEFPVEISARTVVTDGKRHVLSIIRDITERKHAEEKLRRSEASLAITLQSIGDAVIATDATGLVTRMNATAERLTGWPLAEATGRPLAEVFRIVNAGTRVPATDPVQLVMERGEIVGLANHTALLARDGREFLISDSAAPIRDPAGQIVGVVLVFSDVTEKYHTEAALRESEEKFAKVFRRAPVLFVLSDLENGRCLEVNEEVLRLSGFTREEVIGRTVVELGWLTAEERAHLVQAVLQHGRVDDLEKTFQTKTGECRDGLVNAESIVIGGRSCLLTVTTDITVQKLLEVTLRESEKKFATAFRDSPVPMAIRDLETDRYLDANERCLALTGYARSEVVGRSPMEIGWMTEDDRAANLQSLSTTGSVADREIRLRRKDGANVICSYSTHVIQIGGRRCVLSTSIDITERKHAEAAIQESHDLVVKLAAQVPGVVYQYRLYPDGRSCFPFASQGMNDIYEVTPEAVQFDATPVFGRLHPDDLERVAAAIQESARALSPFHCEFRVILPRQGLRWRLSAAAPERTKDGGTLWHGIISDITEQKSAEAALRASEQRYRSILNASPDDVTIADLQGRVLMVSPAGRKMFGYEKEEEFLLRPVTDGLAPEDRAVAASRIALMFQGVMPGVNQYRGLRRDGTTFDMEVNSDFIRDAAGQPTNFIFVARDITARKQTEEALAKANDRLSLAARAGGVGIWEFDISNNRLIWDEEMYRLYGITADQFDGAYAAWRNGVHPDDRARGDAETQAALRGEKEFDTEFRVLWPDGSIHYIRALSLVKRDDQGQPLNMVGTNWDITAQKQVEQALQASLHEKEALLKEVHHRVKNNLQVITSLLRLESGRSTQPNTKSVLEDMQGRIRSMAMLHEALYRSGTFAAVDLGVYLKQITTQLYRALVATPGAIQLQLDLTAAPIEMDQAMPCGLLVNELVSNAFKHGFPNGRTGEVRVELHRVAGGPELRLCVSDTGVGLPANLASRRSQSLGLQLVGDLARQVDGILETDSGPGTRFTITFTPRLHAGGSNPPIKAP